MITVIKAEARHTESFLRLLRDMERFYGNAPPDGETQAVQNASAMLDESVGRYVLLALGDETAVGFATLYAMFPGERLSAQWYIKELFVADGRRGAGVGEALLRFAARLVQQEGGTRLDLVADAANVRAQAFYERLGARIVPRIYYRYDEDALTSLAASPG